MHQRRAAQHLPASLGFLPSASACRLADGVRTRLALDLQKVVGAQLRALLGDAHLLETAWLRRQYPLDDHPPHHGPHTWHQDGALGVDFGGTDARVLDMITAWCPLGACGVDAPGIELVPSQEAPLYSPDFLTQNDRVGEVPVLKAGDVLLMRGHLLHRTWVTPVMRRTRTSAELRFVSEGEARTAEGRTGKVVRV